jgi:RNA polymerase sigma factor (sigma-70 family)
MSHQSQKEQFANRQAIQADSLLVTQILAGQQSLFEDLIKKYEDLLRGYIRRILKDDEQVADVLQYVFLQLYLFLPKLRTNKPLKPWLFRVAYYRCLDELRKKKRHPVVLFSQLEYEHNETESLFIETIPDEQPMLEEVLEQHELHEQLVHILYVLPPALRSIVHLRCFSEMSFSEIGEQLNMPEATAKTYFYRSLPRLRAALQAG